MTKNFRLSIVKMPGYRYRTRNGSSRRLRQMTSLRRQKRTRTLQKKRIKNVVNSMKEKKNVCTADTLTATTSWSYNANFMNVGEGDTSYMRDGFQVHARYLKIRGYINNGDGTNIVRLCVFRNDRNATPTGMPSTINGCFDDVFHQKNKLRYDRRVSLVETYSGGTTQKLFTAYIPLRHLVEYPTQSSGYPAKGGYWVGALSDSGAAVHPSVVYEVEYVYNEK